MSKIVEVPFAEGSIPVAPEMFDDNGIAKVSMNDMGINYDNVLDRLMGENRYNEVRLIMIKGITETKIRVFDEVSRATVATVIEITCPAYDMPYDPDYEYPQEAQDAFSGVVDTEIPEKSLDSEG